MGEDVAASLPGFHAFTGNDYNPAFFGRGKVRPYTFVKKQVEYQQAFQLMGTDSIISNEELYNDCLQTIERFVCLIYGLKNTKTVNDARLTIFTATYKPKKI